MDFAGKPPDKFTAMADFAIIDRSVSGASLYLLLLLMTPLVFPSLRDFSTVVLTAAPVLVLTAAVRLYLKFSFSKNYDRDPKRWKRHMSWSVHTSGASWSAFVCAIISCYDLDWPTWFILLVTSGIASSSTIALNPDLLLLRRYLSILMGPIILWSLTRGTTVWMAVAGVIAVQYLYLWVQAGTSSRSYWQAYQHREELRLAKGNYAALVNSIDGIVWEADPNTFHFTFVSQRAERIVGYPVERWLKDPTFWVSHIHPDDLVSTVTACKQASAQQKDHVLEYRMISDGGEIVWLRDSIAVVTDNGRTVKLCGVMLDVTEHRRAEEQQALLSSAIEQVQESVVITGPDASILYVNPAFERTTGYRRDEVVGQNPRLLKSGQHSPDFYRQMWSALSNGEAWTGHFVNRRRDNSLYEEEAVISPVLDAGGRIVNFVAVKRDVTERRRVERDLKVLAHAIRSIREAVVITDTAGIVTFVNDAFVKIYGYAPSEIVGRNVEALSTPRSPSKDIQGGIVAASLDGGWQGEVRNRRKDGVEFPAFLSTSAIRDEHGRPTALVGISTDITEQKRVEAELRRAKEAAEAASRSKGEFLANMSHEIRTPLNGIMGMTDLALDTRLTLEQQEYLSTVKTSADSLLTVINDILDFSKIEAGHLSLDVEQYSLRSLVYQTIRPMAFRAQQKGIRLTYEIASAVPDSLLGDAGRLRQVLVNLLGNAIKFTEKGSVTLSVGTATMTDDQAELHCVVTDSGIGIPKEKHRTIFDSFAQADTSTTRKYGGTGLGLSISARLVELMGGRIWVESNPGQGSSFHFTVQLGRPGLALDRSPDSLRDMPVLLVDPDPMSSQILERTLVGWGARPRTASGIEEISSILANGRKIGDPFRAVVVSDSLPKVDGLVLAQQICRSMVDPGVSPVIIIILGADRDRSEWKHPFILPCFLNRPLKPSQLKETIRIGLARQRGIRVTAALPPESAGRRRPLRILVAEDNPVNTLVMVRLLEKQGHSVMAARNGSEALQAFEREHFDLILMDVQMPEMDGLDATRAIRASQRTGDPVPIVAMTAHAMKGDRERCLQAGMDDYLTKPIQSSELTRVLDRVAISRRSQPNGTDDSGLAWNACLDDITAVDLVELHNVVALR